MTKNICTNTFGVAKLVVSPNATQGTHTSIQAAINDASAGDTIFVRSGVYIETINLKAGVNLTAAMGSDDTPTVTISGSVTFSSAGTATLSNIKISNSAAATIVFNAASLQSLKIKSCVLEQGGAFPIISNSSSGSAASFCVASNCVLSLTSAASYLFNNSSIAATLLSTCASDGTAATAQSVASAGRVEVSYCGLSVPISISGAAILSVLDSKLDTSAQNVTTLTVAGTGTSFLFSSELLSGTATPVSITSPAVLKSLRCSITSSNAALSTGTGALAFSPVSSAMLDGQLVIGSTNKFPVTTTLTAGSGVTVTNAPGSITIAASGSANTWIDVTGTTQALAINTNYMADNAALVTLTLPAASVFGNVITITGFGSGGWKIAQNAGQQVIVNALATTVGVGGSVASTNRYDTVTLVCCVANTTWKTLSDIGNLTVI